MEQWEKKGWWLRCKRNDRRTNFRKFYFFPYILLNSTFIIKPGLIESSVSVISLQSFLVWQVKPMRKCLKPFSLIQRNTTGCKKTELKLMRKGPSFSLYNPNIFFSSVRPHWLYEIDSKTGNALGQGYSVIGNGNHAMSLSSQTNPIRTDAMQQNVLPSCSIQIWSTTGRY